MILLTDEGPVAVEEHENFQKPPSDRPDRKETQSSPVTTLVISPQRCMSGTYCATPSPSIGK